MRPSFLPEADHKPTLVHDTEACRYEKRQSFYHGMWVGAFLALAFALGAGIGAARYQENVFDRQMRLTKAQYDDIIKTERARIARYAEIDALAQSYDAALAGR